MSRVPSPRADDEVLPRVRGGAGRGFEAGPGPARRRKLMATATARYCGRCGAPLAPGAGFCGRCGTPVLMHAGAAQPVYRYAPAPPVAFPRRQGKLAPALVAGGLVLTLLAVAVVVGAIAIAQFAGGKLAPCTQNCAPKIVTPLPEEASWRSSAYG